MLTPVLIVIFSGASAGFCYAASRWSCRAAATACGFCESLPDHEFSPAPWGLFDRQHHCHQSVALWQPLFGAVLTALAMIAPAPASSLWMGGVVSVMAVAGMIDYHEGILPDFLIHPLLFGGLLVSVAAHPFCDAFDSALGCGLGWFGSSLIANVMKSVKGGNPLGEGDTKAIAAVGAWFGIWGIFHTLCVAVPLMLIVLSMGALRRHQHNSVAGGRFGPYLAIGAALLPYWQR